MELRQIYYVLEIARQKNFSKAAGELYVSQPAISQQIKALEEELQITLFQRDTHGVQLTPDGELFVMHAQTIIDAVDNLMSAFDMDTSKNKTVINVGVFPFYKRTGIRKTLSTFFSQTSNVLGNIKIVENYECYRMIKDKEIDFGIVKLRPENIEDWVEKDILWREPLTVVMSKTNKFADSDCFDIANLGEVRVLTGDTHSHFHVEIKELCKRQGVDFNTAPVYTADTDFMVDLVDDDKGVILATERVGRALSENHDGITCLPIAPVQSFATVLMYSSRIRLNSKQQAFRKYILENLSEDE